MTANFKEPRISKILESDLDYEKRAFLRSLGGNRPQSYSPRMLNKLLAFLGWGLVFGIIIFKFLLPSDFAHSWWLVTYLGFAALIVPVTLISNLVGWLRWLSSLGDDAAVYRSLFIRQYKRYLALVCYALIGTIVVVLIILALVAKYQVKT